MQALWLLDEACHMVTLLQNPVLPPLSPSCSLLSSERQGLAGHRALGDVEWGTEVGRVLARCLRPFS